MKNPPSFVMYVVMFRLRDSEPFDPCWECLADSQQMVFSKGFARKRDADIRCKLYRARYGKKNVYVQQYGPYK